MKQVLTGDFITLKSGGLTAQLITPWSGAYRRTRFHHAAQIRSVTVDGVRFTQAEQDQPGAKSTGGSGLCCEYKCPQLEEDVQVGEEWLKIGVGVLRRGEERWLHLDERRVEPLPTVVHACGDAAEFATEAGAVNGIAYREMRRVEVRPYTIRLYVRLENAGEKPFEVLDYCHNFVSLGDAPIDETHRLFLPALQDVTAMEPNPFFELHPGEMRFVQKPTESFFRPFQPAQAAAPAWTLRKEGSPLSVSETTSFTPDWVSLWGTDYCMCPEVYQRIQLQPGQSAEWTREWTFTT